MKTQTTILLLMVWLTELCPLAAGAADKRPKAADLMAGNSHLAKNRYADALQCYRKAAREGSDGAMQVGQLLLFGKVSAEMGQSVPPDPVEGIQWTFWAATNRNAQACRNLANAFALGIGVKTNLVHAYVWQRVAKEADQSSSMEPLDRLALQLDAQEISTAQGLAKNYYGGEWPVCPVRKVVRGDARFTLNGTTAGGRAPLAVINNRSIAEGESGQIITPKGPLAVTCVEVRASSVLIEVAGENEAHLLELP